MTADIVHDLSWKEETEVAEDMTLELAEALSRAGVEIADVARAFRTVADRLEQVVH